MDLHSYAKRRGSKKWTLEHKRKLVDARISYDNMFVNHPVMSLVPWRKFISIAKLDDYNVMFVRKQWFSLVAKYKQQKENSLGNLPTKAMDNDLLRRMSDEWEFFAPIHRFMTHRTTNLHSYALKEPNQADPTSRRATKTSRSTVTEQSTASCDEPFAAIRKREEDDEEQITVENTHASTSSSERINALCSSDTNDEFAAAMGIRNDHDFYSKKTSNIDKSLDSPRMSYFADGSEDTQESLHLMENKIETLHDDCAVELQLPAYVREEVAETTNDDVMKEEFKLSLSQGLDMHEEGAGVLPANQSKVSKIYEEEEEGGVHIQRTKLKSQPIRKRNSRRAQRARVVKATAPSARDGQMPCNSVRDSYYRHKRRFNHRQERRFDALLSVFGQIVKSEYPSVDVSALSAMAGSATASSDEEMA